MATSKYLHDVADYTANLKKLTRLEVTDDYIRVAIYRAAAGLAENQERIEAKLDRLLELLEEREDGNQ